MLDESEQLDGTAGWQPNGSPVVYLPVGGEAYWPVIVGGPDDSRIAGETVTLSSYDAGMVSPVNDTAVTDANGIAFFTLRGVGVGDENNNTATSPLVFSGSHGEVGLGSALVALPVVVASGSATEGQTGDPQAGFTFQLSGSPTGSITDVIVPYTLAGSTASSEDYNGLPATVTIPAGQTSVFYPISAVQLNTTSANRSVAVTLTNSPLPTWHSRAIFTLYNDNKPTVTIDGQTDNAAVTVDAQGDDSLLAAIGLSVKYEGVLKDVKLSWDPNQMLIWPSDHVGEAGGDLASLQNLTPDGYTGLDTYT